MKIFYISLNFIFFLLFLFQVIALSQTVVKSTKVTINAEKGWQNSGVSLSKEQVYSISAWGAWSSGYETNSCGPEGKAYGTIRDWPMVGFIAKKQPPKLTYESSKNPNITLNIILLGKSGIFKSYGNGTLWLAMGEFSGCKECSGVMEILITTYE